MSPQDELTLLEAAYQQMLQGKIQSYQIDKRSVKYFDLDLPHSSRTRRPLRNGPGHAPKSSWVFKTICSGFGR
jgi:hypothetical protein